MVNKNFCRDVVRKCLHNKTDYPEARLLSEPKCQSTTKCWYMVYRWILFFSWIFIIICSLLEVGSFNPKGHRELWLIYLTHWDLILGTIQSLLGAILVTKRWRLEKLSNFEADRLTLGRLEKTYWFLYIITASMAVGVTLTYWVAVYNPKIHAVDPLNIMLHVCNSMLMLLDIFVSNVPFRIRSFWWCPMVVLVYLTFSLIYFSAGGLDEHGNHYIYKILDWKKPQQSLLICFGGLTFVVLLHYVLYFLSLLRDVACKRSYEVNKEANKTLKDNNQVDIIKTKKAELIV